MSKGGIMVFTKDTKIREITQHPSFRGFGHLLFPLQLAFHPEETVQDVTDSNHFIWYSNLKTKTSLEVLNNLLERAQKNEQIFFPIYDKDEMVKDPSKRETGLFYFKGKEYEKFALVNAGGGFHYVAALHDSFPQALALSQRGYNAFALIYRPKKAYEDLAQALDYLYSHSSELKIDPDQYSLWGGSAGARMAIRLGNKSELQRLTRTSIEPASIVVSQYTGYSSVSRDDAPTYANCGTNDGIANWQVMENRLKNLKKLGIESQFHVYKGLRHGFGIGKDTVAEDWIDNAISFWEKQINK